MVALYLTMPCSTLFQNGTSALIAGAAEGHVSAMSLLLNAKADVNLADHVRHELNLQKL